MLINSASSGARERLRSLAATPAAVILLATAATWAIAYVVLSTHLWRDPRSAFFNDKHAFDLQYSKHRLNEASRYIQQLETSTAAPQKAGDPVICAALITVNRKKEQYLSKTIGSLLEGLTPEERSALHVRLLFANGEPSIHPDWNKRWLQALDHTGTYNITNETKTWLRELERTEDFQVKGVFDYTYMLDECLHNTNAPYIAILEDDIVLADGWLAKTLDGLAMLRERAATYLYLRPFYTETHLGWHDEDDYWWAHKRTTFSLAIISTAAFLGFVRVAHRNSRRYLDYWTIGILALVAVPAFTNLFFMSGTYYVWRLNYGVHKMNHHGCCTQFLVFPRSQVAALVSHLRELKKGQTDLLIEEYAYPTDLDRFALAPPVAQHIGLISSRGMDEINTQHVWAYFFESQDPVKLKKEHEKLARWGIWRAVSDGDAAGGTPGVGRLGESVPPN